MFSKEELFYIQSILKQITFKAGQKDQFLMNEQILEIIKNVEDKRIRNLKTRSRNELNKDKRIDKK